MKKIFAVMHSFATLFMVSNTPYPLASSVKAVQSKIQNAETIKNLLHIDGTLDITLTHKIEKLIRPVFITKSHQKIPLLNVITPFVYTTSKGWYAQCFINAESAEFAILMPEYTYAHSSPEEIMFIIGHEVGHKVIKLTFEKDYYNKYLIQPIYLILDGINATLSAFMSAKCIIAFSRNNILALSDTQLMLLYWIIALGGNVVGKYLFDKTNMQQASHFTEVFCDTFGALITKNIDAGINYLTNINTPFKHITEIPLISSHPRTSGRIKNLQKLKTKIQHEGYPTDPTAFAYSWTFEQFPVLR